MAEIIGGIIIVLALLIFTFLILKPGSGRKRRDDRDMKKSAELNRAPKELYQMQEPADLQVGEDRQLAQQSRFEPDTAAKRAPRGVPVINRR